MTVTEFLRERVPFLSGLTPEEAHELALAVEQQDYRPGQAIVLQGTTVDGVHVVAAGTVSVTVKPQGRAPAEVARLGTGEVFGEMSIVEFGVAGATVRAAEDTHLFFIPQDVFRGLMERKPAVREMVLANISARRARRPEPELAAAR